MSSWDDFVDNVQQGISYTDAVHAVNAMLTVPTPTHSPFGVSVLDDTKFIKGDGIHRTYSNNHTTIVPDQVSAQALQDVLPNAQGWTIRVEYAAT